MKKILILLSFAVVLSANTCQYYIESYNKNVKKVKLDLITSKTSLYAGLAKNDLINMLVECNVTGKEYEKGIVKIKELDSYKRYKGK